MLWMALGLLPLCVVAATSGAPALAAPSASGASLAAGLPAAGSGVEVADAVRTDAQVSGDVQVSGAARTSGGAQSGSGGAQASGVGQPSGAPQAPGAVQSAGSAQPGAGAGSAGGSSGNAQAGSSAGTVTQDTYAPSAGPQFHIVLNGRSVGPEAQILMRRDTLYAPIRFISEQFGAKVDWRSEDQAIDVETPLGDKAVFTIGESEVEFNGQTDYLDGYPFVVDGKSYLPLRIVAEILHSRVDWDNATQTATFTSVAPYQWRAGDTLKAVSQQLGLSEAVLKARNGWDRQPDWSEAKLTAGQTVRTIVPEFMQDQAKYADVPLLAKIIDAEAAYEPFKGQVAVGDVVLNRVKDSRFPDTVHGVVYAPGQFPPALDGELNGITPRSSCVEAAVRALNGEDVVGNAVYFYNPKVDDNAFFESLKTVAAIGGHKFAE